MSQWNESLQERWNALSRKHLEEGLTAEEQQEWAQLEKILETEELERLQPALQRYDVRLSELQEALASAKQEKEKLLSALQERRQVREALDAPIQQLEQEYQTLSTEFQEVKK